MAPSGDLTPKALLKAPIKVNAAEPMVQVEPAILRKPDAARFMGVSETIFAAQAAGKKYPAWRLVQPWLTATPVFGVKISRRGWQ